MMRRVFILLFALFTGTTLLAQDDYGVPGFDSIVANPVEYRAFIDKFAKGEERLTPRECIIAYYGFARQVYYTGDLIDGEREMQESVLAGDFETTYQLGTVVLQRNPINLTALYWTLAAAVETKKPWEVRNSLRTRYNNVTVAIASSGNGILPESAFKVVATGDMYTYCMIELEVGIEDRYLVDHRYNMLEVTPSEIFSHEFIYFDSCLPLNFPK